MRLDASLDPQATSAVPAVRAAPRPRRRCRCIAPLSDPDLAQHAAPKRKSHHCAPVLVCVLTRSALLRAWTCAWTARLRLRPAAAPPPCSEPPPFHRAFARARSGAAYGYGSSRRRSRCLTTARPPCECTDTQRPASRLDTNLDRQATFCRAGRGTAAAPPPCATPPPLHCASERARPLAQHAAPKRKSHHCVPDSPLLCATDA